MIWTAFLLGFLGSFHCLGMCGPIALSLSAKDKSRYLKNKLVYNLGRTITYSVLGGMIGLVGFSLALAGIQQWISISMGIAIIVMAFFYKRSERMVTQSGLLGVVGKLRQQLGKYLTRGGTRAFFATGLLNGVLPCGMVYLALIASLAMQSPVLGAAYMFFFGVGTIPMLLTVMMTQQIVAASVRVKLTKAIPYFAMVVGILFIVRGMGLGVHYLSPHLVYQNPDTVELDITLCE
nr:sulfite exporter TauE/SafE family protein [Cytophagales bacterium]